MNDDDKDNEYKDKGHRDKRPFAYDLEAPEAEAIPAEPPAQPIEYEEKIGRLKTDSIILQRLAVLEVKVNLFLTGLGITFATIVALAFWLGGSLAKLDATLAQFSQKTDKVYEVVLTSSDSLNTRTRVIEAKLDAIDKKLPARK